MALVILLVAVIGWGMLFAVVLPGHYEVAGRAPFDLGLAFTAFTLGARHALDADHIAAIDNSTRRLVAQGQKPVTVGFWFALGHSSVVIGAVALLAAGLNGLAGQLSRDDSQLQVILGTGGGLVAVAFLLLIGSLNLHSLEHIRRSLKALRAGTYSPSQYEQMLETRGLLNRLFRRAARGIDRPAKMYLIGLLFGLGFDTATTIALFVIGGSAALTAPWYVVLVLPILFTAGMLLIDSLDGVLMNRAYQWAYAQPVRRIYYNFTVTLMSVTVAFLVAVIVLIGLIADAAGVDTGPVAWIAAIDFQYLGLLIVAMFALIWFGALAYWKFGDVENRYSISE